MPQSPHLLNKRIQPRLHIPRHLPGLAAIAPNVPVGTETPLRALRADLRAGFAFVGAVVPFADGVCDVDWGGCAGGGGGRGGRGSVPRVAIATS